MYIICIFGTYKYCLLTSQIFFSVMSLTIVAQWKLYLIKISFLKHVASVTSALSSKIPMEPAVIVH